MLDNTHQERKHLSAKSSPRQTGHEMSQSLMSNLLSFALTIPCVPSVARSRNVESTTERIPCMNSEVDLKTGLTLLYQ